jgi:hypothetical protein
VNVFLQKHKVKLLLGLFGLISLVLTFNLRLTWASDDIFFHTQSAAGGPWGGSMVEFLRWRLATWTSRVAIEAALFTFVQHTVGWRLITALTFWIVAVVPTYLVTKNDAQRLPLLLINGLLVLSVPATVWFDAGLIATTVNYLWPLAAGLLAAVPAVFFIQRRPLKFWWLLAAIGGLLFASSSEIVAVLLLALYLVAAIILGLQLRQPGQLEQSASSPSRQLQVLVSALFIVGLGAMTAFHIFSPGNAARGQGGNWFSPVFFVQLEQAYSSTLRQIFMSGYLLPLTYFVIIAVICFRRFGYSWQFAVSLAPIAGSLLLRDATVEGTLGRMFQNLFVDGNLFWNTADAQLRSTMYFTNLLVFGVLTVLLVCAVLATAFAFSGSSRLWVVLGVLAAGFASKFIVVSTIGFALEIPFHRTDLYLLFSFLFAALLALITYFDSSATGARVRRKEKYLCMK